MSGRRTSSRVGEFLVGETDGEAVAMGALRPAGGYVTELLDGLKNAAR